MVIDVMMSRFSGCSCNLFKWDFYKYLDTLGGLFHALATFPIHVNLPDRKDNSTICSISSDNTYIS